MTPDKGAVDYSTTNAFVVARTGAKWRPRNADDTWNSESWKVGDTLYSFCRGWNVLFDGQEENPLSTVSVPDGVAPGTVTVTGARNYSFAGDGKISGKLVKSGSGTLTLPVTQFADPLEFNVTGGTLSMPGTMYFGNAAGQARLTIGGGDGPAKVLLNDKGASFGRGAGSETYITVCNHGLIRNDSAEWTRFGVIYGAMTTLEVEAGGEVDGNWVLLGSQAARCNARVAGTITVRGNFLGVGEGSDTSLTLLPGGRIRARGTQAWLNSAVWSKYTGHPTLHVKSGTLELYPVATYNTSTPILNTLLPVTYVDRQGFSGISPRRLQAPSC